MPPSQNTAASPAPASLSVSDLGNAANDAFLSGRLDEALGHCEALLKIEPRRADVISMVASVHTKQGDHESALKYYEQALHFDPYNVNYFRNVAQCYYLLGHLERAREYYAQALMLQPGNAAFFNNHGYISYELGDPVNAAESLQKAVFYDPSNIQFKHGYMRAISERTYGKFDPAAKMVMIACLEDDRLFHQNLMPAWQSLLCVDSVFEPLRRLYDARDYEAAFKTVSFQDFLPCFEDRFLLLGLKRCVLAHTGIENAFTMLRRYLLENIQKGLPDDEFAATLPFLAALAEQCWYNEYVFDVTAPENSIIEEFRSELEEGLTLQDNCSMARFLTLACYQPLYSLANAAALSAAAKETGNEALSHIVTLQIDEPLQEREIRKTFKSFGTIKNDISVKVRDQYENNPYPRWKSTDIYESEEDYTGKSVLIAGCGTGREITHSLSGMRGAEILAVDLSLSSLSYAKRQLEKIGLTKGYEFLHGDLLELDQLGRKFDFVISSGVIHHMQDPLAGWKMLQSLLNPGGVLRLGLYSQTARRPITLARQYIAQQGYEPTAENIRKVRKHIMGLPDGDPLKGCMYWRDFFSMSECRDHLFHVQEHQFTLPQIQGVLHDLGMEFIEFVTYTNARSVLYGKRFPDDPQMRNLGNWHILEQENPLLFYDMYQFRCRNRSA